METGNRGKHIKAGPMTRDYIAFVSEEVVLCIALFNEGNYLNKSQAARRPSVFVYDITFILIYLYYSLESKKSPKTTSAQQ